MTAADVHIPLRWGGASWELIVGLLLLALAMYALAAMLRSWSEKRERRRVDPRGGSGITLVDGRVAPLPVIPSSTPEQRGEEWLLGFAAPLVARAGLDGRRWDLRSDDADVDERLRDTLRTTGAVDRRRWDDDRRRAEDAFARALSDQTRARTLVELTYRIRLGVAARHLSEEQAHAMTRAAAVRLPASIGDWLAFGDLYAADRATVAALYRPGGAWADNAWPPR